MTLMMAALLLQSAVEERTQGQAGGARFFVDYMAHSFLKDGAAVFLSNYLAMEVEIVPPRGGTLTVSQNQFTLRVNSRKPALLPQSSGFVAASLKYSDWDRQRRIDASVGGIRIGSPQQIPRFPGDPTRRPLPAPPRAPEPEDRSGLGKPPEEPADQLVVKWALPEGETAKPVKGFLYFPHKGKPGSVKKLELIYSGPAGDTAIVLR